MGIGQPHIQAELVKLLHRPPDLVANPKFEIDSEPFQQSRRSDTSKVAKLGFRHPGTLGDLLHLAAAQASRAHQHPLDAAANRSANLLQIRMPSALGLCCSHG